MVEVLSLNSEAKLTLGFILKLLRENVKLTLDSETSKRMLAYRSKLREKIENTPLYGVSTGFGVLKDVVVPLRDARKLQVNLVRSHSIGVGDYASIDVVRLTTLFKALELSKGYSGVRPEIVEKLLEVYNGKIHVYIPLHGSVGACGDLAPLSHLALFLIGEGEYLDGDVRRKGCPEGFQPISLDFKEGISLVNGTAFSLALLTHSLLRSYRLLDRALIGLALSFTAMKGNLNAYEELVHEVKKHSGQKIIALKLKRLLEGSSRTINSQLGRDQDPYCLRCIPQLLGPTVEILEYAKKVVEREANSITDNPIVDLEGRVYNECNFHAMYLAQTSDYLKTALVTVGELSEKHVDKLLNGAHRAGLPKFLAKNPGLNSGLMLLQYTMASLLAEVKSLATPTSIYNTPTSGGQEDVNSMSVPSLVMLEEELKRLEWIVTGLIVASTLALKLDLESESLGGAIEDFYLELSKSVEDKVLVEDTPYYRVLEGLREKLFPESLESYKYYVLQELVES